MEITMRLKRFLRTTALSFLAAATVLTSGALAGCSKSEDSRQTDADGKDQEDSKNQKDDDKSNPTPTADAQDENDDASDKEDLSDTVRWFNASYAILTELNGWDYTIFAGAKPGLMMRGNMQSMLEESWGVTDRASADETLDWILTEGHRYGFADDMTYLQECGLGEIAADNRIAFILENFDVSQEDAEFYVNTYAMYETYGAEAIDAWDYCRAMNLMGFFYLAGYYTETEALDTSLDIAKVLQAKFGSWDALVDSYLRGYEYWAEENSDARREVYEDLKKRDDNPYSVNYNTELTKTW